MGHRSRSSGDGRHGPGRWPWLVFRHARFVSLHKESGNARKVLCLKREVNIVMALWNETKPEREAPP